MGETRNRQERNMDFKLTACFRRIGHMWIGYGFRADCFAAVQSKNRFCTEGGKFATIDAIATILASPREEEGINTL